MVNPVVPASPTPKLTLQSAGLLAAAAKLDVDRAKERQDIVRNAFNGLFADLHRQTGAKSVNLTLPDGTRVGTATFNDKSDAPKVVDERAFQEWVMANPEWEDHVETVVRVRESFMKELLKKLVWVPETRQSQAPKLRTVAVTDEDGNVLNVDGEPLQEGQEPDTIEVPVLDDHGNPVFEDEPVLDGDGQPLYLAFYPLPDGQPGELVPGVRLLKGRTNTDSFTIRWVQPKAGEAKVAGQERHGAALLATYMENNNLLESMTPAALDAPTVNGE